MGLDCNLAGKAAASSRMDQPECRTNYFLPIEDYGVIGNMQTVALVSKTDASNLIMPLVFFMAPDDPRLLQTLERTLLPPKFGGLTVNHLVFRYHQSDEDLEGTFSICSFWLVEALARAGVRHPRLLCEAQIMFDDIVGYANHLGLFSEEIGLDGSARGNFPQAFTHLSLISAAFNLDRALGP